MNVTVMGEDANILLIVREKEDTVFVVASWDMLEMVKSVMVS